MEPSCLCANTSNMRMHMTTDMSADSVLLQILGGGGRVELVNASQLPVFIRINWLADDAGVTSRSDFMCVYQSLHGDCLLGRRSAEERELGSREWAFAAAPGQYKQ
eukprot:3809434-Pleurochrysis_carterae.AAC.1